MHLVDIFNHKVVRGCLVEVVRCVGKLRMAESARSHRGSVHARELVTQLLRVM